MVINSHPAVAQRETEAIFYRKREGKIKTNSVLISEETEVGQANAPHALIDRITHVNKNIYESK